MSLKAFPHSRAIATGDSAVDVDIRLAVYAVEYVRARRERPPPGMPNRDPDWTHRMAMDLANEAVEANRRARGK